MADSDVEESFTFGSFTLEDTEEFKRSYNGLHVRARCAKPIFLLLVLVFVFCCYGGNVNSSSSVAVC